MSVEAGSISIERYKPCLAPFLLAKHQRSLTHIFPGEVIRILGGVHECDVLCRSAEQREEWQRWRSVRPDMAGSVVRELCCKDGLYRAEMEPMQL